MVHERAGRVTKDRALRRRDGRVGEMPTTVNDRKGVSPRGGNTAGGKYLVVRVRGNVVIGAAERARQKLASTFEGAGALALVVPKAPMTFEKEFFVTTADALE